METITVQQLQRIERWTAVRDDSGNVLFQICLDASHLSVEKSRELLACVGTPELPAAFEELSGIVGLRTNVELDTGEVVKLSGKADIERFLESSNAPSWVATQALIACWNRVFTQEVTVGEPSAASSKRGSSPSTKNA